MYNILRKKMMLQNNLRAALNFSFRIYRMLSEMHSAWALRKKKLNLLESLLRWWIISMPILRLIDLILLIKLCIRNRLIWIDHNPKFLCLLRHLLQVFMLMSIMLLDLMIWISNLRIRTPSLIKLMNLITWR